MSKKSKHATLRIRLEGAGGDVDAQDAITREVTHVTRRFSESLGIVTAVDIEHRISERGFRMFVDDNQIRVSHTDMARARMKAAGRLLTSAETAHSQSDLLSELDDSVRVAWIAALFEASLITRPGLLMTRQVTTATISRVAAQLGIKTRWEVLAPLVHAAVADGISLRAVTKTANVEALTGSGQDAVETFVSMLHPRSITLCMHPSDLERMMRTDRHADEHPFASVHDRARNELGLPLPSLELHVGDVSPGWYRVQINHIPELEQPLLPPGQGLSYGEQGDVYVVPWRVAAQLGDVKGSVNCSELQYVALEVFDFVARRSTRLIERKEVMAWCSALGKPSLLALAMTADHFVDLPRVLRSLLSEGISIRDFETILERIIDHHTIEVSGGHSQVILSQAFPVVENLPPKEARLIDSVRLGLGEAIHTRIGSKRVRIAFLSPPLEYALTRDQMPVWRDQFAETIAQIDPRTCDAIVTTNELRAVVRAISYEGQSDLPVFSFHELPATLEVTTATFLDLPEGVPVRMPPVRGRAPVPQLADGFGLLLADHDRLAPALPDVVTDLVPPARSPDSQPRRPSIAYDPIARPDSLPDQGWAVIVPKGQFGEMMLDALTALIEHRREKQGARARVLKLSLEDSLRPYTWIRNSFESILQMERPRYVMLVGDFDTISLELQLALAPLAAVGRLPFSTPDEIRAYAQKVIDAEKGAGHAAIRSCVFVAGDDSDATEIARAHLAVPCMQRIETDPKVEARSVVLVDGSKEALLSAAAEHDFLLSTSHGLGTRMTYAQRRERQGALLTRSGELLTAEDVAERPFVRNGFWFLFACYGLGTPSESSYSPWIEHLFRSDVLKQGTREMIESGLLQAGESPFAAALPRRALANPNGPIAVMGHVDMAWSYGFMQDNQSRSDRLYAAMRILLRGQRAGLALEELQKSFSSVSDQVNEAYVQQARGSTHVPEISKRELARLWMLRQDLRGFVMFGDPAVRIGGRT